ncbi:hypothetical protein TPCCA_0126c [Treponema paraluiscuniculi Cuniculi A]|uniref:Uncharacterized protein n=3 Tax=Treponema paraluiscuniculi TaxID=53435 RepID=F7XRX0_TREPU|nr:hypothetical protein TPCCA_0126c [Treponema paraluiscuniculi Cuniculi A]WKC72020.1 hypothetical protein TPLL2_0126c [Treponema paraluiscuniculi]
MCARVLFLCSTSYQEQGLQQQLFCSYRLYVLWFAPAWTTPLLSLPSQCTLSSLLDGATIGCNAPDTSEKLNEPPHSRSPRLRCPALRLSYAPRGWRSRVRSWPC